MNRTLMLGFALCGVIAGTAPGAERPSYEELVANLKSQNVKTRLDAVTALGKSRLQQAIQPLSEMVRDPEPRVRLELVRAFRGLRNLEAVPTIVTSLQDGDPKIRGEAIAALVELYTDYRRPTAIGSFLDIFSDDTDRGGVLPNAPVDASAIQGLAGLLRDEEKGIRTDAAFAIGVLGGTAAAKELVAVLQDPETDVRASATTAIGRVGTSDDGKALIPLLADGSDNVRRRVLKSLGLLRVKEAGPALRELYETNKRKDLGMRALDCLSRVGDPSQTDLFRDLYQNPDPERRRLAIEGLARVSDASMLSAFTKDYQRERNEEIKLAYSFALVLLGNRAFLDSLVLCLPSNTLGTRCRDYVLEMGRDVLSELYPYLSDADAEVRGEVCDLLMWIGDPEAIPQLQPLLNDTNRRVSDRANRAVERLRRISTGRKS